MNKKVEYIEFSFNFDESEDFILRAAELIKEGYKVDKIKYNRPMLSTYDHIRMIPEKEEKQITITLSYFNKGDLINEL